MTCQLGVTRKAPGRPSLWIGSQDSFFARTNLASSQSLVAAMLMATLIQKDESWGSSAFLFGRNELITTQRCRFRSTHQLKLEVFAVLLDGLVHLTFESVFLVTYQLWDLIFSPNRVYLTSAWLLSLARCLGILPSPMCLSSYDEVVQPLWWFADSQIWPEG